MQLTQRKPCAQGQDRAYKRTEGALLSLWLSLSVLVSPALNLSGWSQAGASTARCKL